MAVRVVGLELPCGAHAECVVIQSTHQNNEALGKDVHAGLPFRRAYPPALVAIRVPRPTLSTIFVECLATCHQGRPLLRMLSRTSFQELPSSDPT